MTRRSPDAIVAALEMDPLRRQLVVEGPSDRHLLEWLARDCLSDDLIIEDAGGLELDAEGGARGKLVALATAVGYHERLLVFVDADADPPIGPARGSVLITTDMRDAESYFLNESSFEKLLRVGMATGIVEAPTFLATVLAEAGKIAVLRRLSREQGWNLPFQDTPLAPSITATRTTIHLDLKKAVRRLASQSIGLARVDEVLGLHAEMTAKLVTADPLELIHGKDAVAIATELLCKFGVSRQDGPRLMRMSIDHALTVAHPNIAHVVHFMC